MKIEPRDIWLIIVGFLKNTERAEKELSEAINILNKHFGIEE